LDCSEARGFKSAEAWKFYWLHLRLVQDTLGHHKLLTHWRNDCCFLEKLSRARLPEFGHGSFIAMGTNGQNADAMALASSLMVHLRSRAMMFHRLTKRATLCNVACMAMSALPNGAALFLIAMMIEDKPLPEPNVWIAIM
jgi:hypothetical protein